MIVQGVLGNHCDIVMFGLGYHSKEPFVQRLPEFVFGSQEHEEVFLAGAHEVAYCVPNEPFLPGMGQEVALETAGQILLDGDGTEVGFESTDHIGLEDGQDGGAALDTEDQTDLGDGQDGEFIQESDQDDTVLPGQGDE